MSEQPGLRERKKDATRHRLTQAALDLFEERGFDEVSVAEVADAAEVSKKTVFNYFDSKEDLIVGHGKRLMDEPARLVRERAVGQTPHGAIREHWFTMLAKHHPITGLCDDRDVMRVIRVIHATPQLMQRQLHYGHHSQELLALALLEEAGAELSARLIAAQIFGVRQQLAVDNFRSIANGATATEHYPNAVADAEIGFDLLTNGLGNLLLRKELNQRIPGYQPCGLTLRTGPLAVVG